ncbi:hypothetical protein NQ317_016595 [Molorchus minor]|uniref:Choline transporter-like protein n=1 Tax=Molorchus minor TaxID=1323400 RepID=A0ABQ9ITP1_9CUCU|nr:hypothetical protein NQ317_016595 [Molorchus minor]
MGSCLSSDMKPEELSVFKDLPPETLLDVIEIPERAEHRKPTDRRFIIVYAVAVALLLPFMIYTMCFADSSRLLSFYDECGNSCGIKNSKHEDVACSGKDLTDKPYMMFEGHNDPTRNDGWLSKPRSCVQTCPAGYNPIFNICIASDKDDSIDYIMKVGLFLKNEAWRIVFSCFVSIGVAIGVVVLYRTATKAMVYTTLIVVSLLTIVGVILLWVSVASTPLNAGTMTFAIVLTVLLVFFLCVLIFLRKKIGLVIALLQEAMKTVFDLPQLLMVPVLTFLAQLVLVCLFLTTLAYMLTAGILTPLDGYLGDYYYYELTMVMKFTHYYNFAIYLWTSQIIVGIQYMVIAGAVAKWYFAKNKKLLDRPLRTSVFVTFLYHLGSIVMGSLIIIIVMIVRSLISAAIRNRVIRACVDALLRPIERFLKYLTKNAYIVIAMHGKPFCKSGKRGGKIILDNAINVVAINFIGDFILAMAQLTIVFISMIFTFAIMQGAHSLNNDDVSEYVAYGIVFLFSLMAAVTAFSVFETVIDSLFICFCEDSLMNDGMARPYAMSRELMEFLDNAKTVFVKKKNSD